MQCSQSCIVSSVAPTRDALLTDSNPILPSKLADANFTFTISADISGSNENPIKIVPSSSRSASTFGVESRLFISVSSLDTAIPMVPFIVPLNSHFTSALNSKLGLYPIFITGKGFICIDGNFKDISNIVPEIPMPSFAL